MFIKIAIYPDFGSIYIPKFMEKQLSNRKFVYNRIEMAEIIEKLEPTHEAITQEIYEAYKSNKPNELNFFDYIKGANESHIIYVKDFENKPHFIYRIVVQEIDTSNIWRIDDYDGAEAIEYFSEPEIVDKDLNLGEW